MLMRVAVGIHKDDIDSVIKTYHLMSQRWFTHASPTLFNAGTPRPQVRFMPIRYSCLSVFLHFLFSFYVLLKKDLFTEIWLNAFRHLYQVSNYLMHSLWACFDSWAVAFCCAWKMIVLKAYMILWRSVLLSANLLEELVSLFTIFVLLVATFVEQMGRLMALFPCYVCSMILPGMLIKEEARGKVFLRCYASLEIWHLMMLFGLLFTSYDAVGAFAVYLEPWHADIFEFLDLRKNHGKVCWNGRKFFIITWFCFCSIFSSLSTASRFIII